MWYSCVGHRGKNQQGKGGGCSSFKGRVVPNDFGVFARYHTSTGVFNPKLVRKCVCVQLARLDPRHAGPTGRWRTEFRVSPPGLLSLENTKTRKNTPVGDFTLKKTLHSAPSFNWIYICTKGTKGDVVQPGHIQKTQEESSIHLSSGDERTPRRLTPKAETLFFWLRKKRTPLRTQLWTGVLVFLQPTNRAMLSSVLAPSLHRGVPVAVTRSAPLLASLPYSTSSDGTDSAAKDNKPGPVPFVSSRGLATGSGAAKRARTRPWPS